MKKRILMLLLIIILSGCTCEYNLEIKDDNFIETIKAYPESDELNDIGDIKKYALSSNTNSVIYEKLEEDLGDSKLYTFKHKYSLEEFNNNLNGKCFSDLKVNYMDGYYSIIGTDFSCFGGQDEMADSYKINITTDYIVANNNADEVSGNTYTWNINKKNYKNKSIIFQYSKTKNKIDLLSIIKTISISIIVGIFISIGILIFQKYKNQNNEL